MTIDLHADAYALNQIVDSVFDLMNSFTVAYGNGSEEWAKVVDSLPDEVKNEFLATLIKDGPEKVLYISTNEHCINNKVNAIKAHREVASSSLKEAHDVVTYILGANGNVNNRYIKVNVVNMTKQQARSKLTAQGFIVI